MSTTDYHFIDKWRVSGDVKEVANIIDDALSLPRWWPSVYFEVKEVAPGARWGRQGDQFKSSRLAALFVASELRTIESRYPHGFSMEASGDLEGKGTGLSNRTGISSTSLTTGSPRQQGNHPGLSFLLKPIFAQIIIGQ